mgnify:CR=1 FL=1
MQVRIATVSDRESRILAIIGQGYVGLPLALAACGAGYTVIGVDRDADKKPAALLLKDGDDRAVLPHLFDRFAGAGNGPGMSEPE